jgi:hypothetical protein
VGDRSRERERERERERAREEREGKGKGKTWGVPWGGGLGVGKPPLSQCLLMSSRTTATFPESLVQLQQSSAVRRYRDARGNGISLRETRHDRVGRNGAIEYVLKDESRRGFTGPDLGLLCLGLVLWAITRPPIGAVLGLLGLLGLALGFRSTLLPDRTSEC